ncbi:glycoside hydrolase family 27 protein [Saccharopolyspora sp. 6T]|uniref:glycoside hydrolase family 27 protein n=1 Tax=Saccharopolyspora sp. 6T TaxID=2877238 RepID=UPI001CD1D4D5|nr:glycoside hydrolase family 27 protein [Saccharopolyspora sp. 6T]MCA1187770.1 glycoside hydrolase family 27 protein [Saccharopolyspora sp. 6T]
MPSIALALLVVLALAGTSAPPRDTAAGGPLPGPPAATPPMGWNSWNTFGCDIDEAKIRGVADAMVASGMRDAGYRYVVVDDCWYEPDRDAAGNLRADRTRFPSGMAALGEHLHAQGLLFGIYASPNVRTCAQRTGAYPGATGSGDREVQDARTFASWGVDYLKYDWCSGGGSTRNVRVAFTAMRDALAATGRPIVYSTNPNSNFPGEPGESEDWCGVAHLARTTEDIQPVWDSGHRNEHPMGVRNIIDVHSGLADRVRPGCWNDPDMLEVGVHGVNGYAGLTPDEERTHLSMWAMFAAPLIAGNDPRTMSEADRALLTDPELLAVDQDPLGAAAHRVRGGDHQVWVKPLLDGTAIALHNQADTPARITTGPAELGLPAGARLARNLNDGTTGPLTADVPAHGTVLLRIDHLSRPGAHRRPGTPSGHPRRSGDPRPGARSRCGARRRRTPPPKAGRTRRGNRAPRRWGR